jgi:RNA polymerase sigma-70 factor, ECF subfamily
MIYRNRLSLSGDLLDKNGGSLDLRDSAVFSQVFLATHTQVFRYLYGLTGGPAEEVEDLLAETYTHAWRARSRFHGDEDTVIFWLLKIAHNQAFDAYRRRKARIAPYPMDDQPGPQVPAPEPGPEQNLINLQAREEVWRKLQTLSSEVKEMLVLRYFMDWQIKQIARYLGKKETTVTMAIHRALAGFPRQSSSTDPSTRKDGTVCL